ncbi:hypothetical protein CY35_10G093400 [Sphagnum magellanicum]|nr:hypothetical protein CY35_10G093400 [Sphagnum magellanicum]KAH9550849.1 hypothetical protein CY35_10G093400 [Sphagnum magellanicum]
MAEDPLALHEPNEPAVGGGGGGDEAVIGKEFISGLPNDIAKLCLARVPRAWHWCCRMVSKAWRDEVGSKSFRAKRIELGISEDWPFMVLSGSRHWHKFDPIRGQWLRITDMPADEMFFNMDKECFGAGHKLMVVGCHLDADSLRIVPWIWSYNIPTFTWVVAPSMTTSRCLFASATFGDYGYVAGGSQHQGRPVLRTAERYNSITNRWEVLPDMIMERKECSGFIMEGCFCVIGGIDEKDMALTSGEFYDPRIGAWTLVPNQWPGFSQWATEHPAPPLVAVVANQLYALDAFNNHLKKYDKATNLWVSLDVVPHRSPQSSGWGLGFKAVGQELWVIGGQNPHGGPRIDACTIDTATGSISWRGVAFTWGSGFCYNCAVIKVPCQLCDAEDAPMQGD